MILALFLALFSIEASKASHERAFHQNQLHENEVPQRSKAVAAYYQRCVEQTTELNCLQQLFNDEYFWAK